MPGPPPPRLIALGVALSAWLAASAAHAAPTSRLVYSRSTDAGSCPDEQALRRAVATRVGYDPFFAYATRTIVASVTRRDLAFVATVDLIDDNGFSHGARELRAEGDCSELLDAVALAIAIAIDPQSLTRAEPPPSPGNDPPAPPPVLEADPTPLPRPEPPPRPVQAPPARPARRAQVVLTTGIVVSAGVAPGAAAVGLDLGAGVRARPFSVALEARVDAPSGQGVSTGGSVSSWLLVGAIVPCLHLENWFACAVTQAGSAQAHGSGPGTRSARVPWWADGGRIGAHFPVAGGVGLRLRADLLANIARATLKLDGLAAWQAPPVAGSFGAELVFPFP